MLRTSPYSFTPGAFMNYDLLTLGTGSLTRALELWQGALGLEPVPEDTPSARSLEQFLKLPEGAVRHCAVLATPGAPGGRLQLVEFAAGADRVRADAAVTDHCPKNLDVNVIDLPARLAALRAAGLEAPRDYTSYELEGLRVREVQLPLEDGVNLVLVELIGEALTVTGRGFGALTSIVTTTGDLDRERAFFEALGFDTLDYHELAGPDIEAMIGLPARARLQIQLLGDRAHRFGRAELIEYQGAQGRNLYPRAEPPAIGLLRGRVTVDDLDAAGRRWQARGLAPQYGSQLTVPRGTYRGCTLTSPSGWVIEAVEQPATHSL